VDKLDFVDKTAEQVANKPEHRLSAAARKKIPTKKFAGPDRSFPIENKAHARAAIMDSKYAADPAAIKAKAEAVLRK
jgi:hypothetical protein